MWYAHSLKSGVGGVKQTWITEGDTAKFVLGDPSVSLGNRSKTQVLVYAGLLKCGISQICNGSFQLKLPSVVVYAYQLSIDLYHDALKVRTKDINLNWGNPQLPDVTSNSIANAPPGTCTQLHCTPINLVILCFPQTV